MVSRTPQKASPAVISPILTVRWYFGDILGGAHVLKNTHKTVKLVNWYLRKTILFPFIFLNLVRNFHENSWKNLRNPNLNNSKPKTINFYREFLENTESYPDLPYHGCIDPILYLPLKDERCCCEVLSGNPQWKVVKIVWKNQRKSHKNRSRKMWIKIGENLWEIVKFSQRRRKSCINVKVNFFQGHTEQPCLFC